MGLAGDRDDAAGLEETTDVAGEDPGRFLVAVVAARAELVEPDDERVVEERAAAFGDGGELAEEVGELLGVPGVDLDELGAHALQRLAVSERVEPLRVANGAEQRIVRVLAAEPVEAMAGPGAAELHGADAG